MFLPEQHYHYFKHQRSLVQRKPDIKILSFRSPRCFMLAIHLRTVYNEFSLYHLIWDQSLKKTLCTYLKLKQN